MNRRSLGALAIVIIFLMIVVATAGLDNLPRDVRNSISAASAKLKADQTELAQNRDYINHALAAEPVLFRTKAPVYRDRLQQDAACLAAAAAQLTTLEQIRKQNRREDADKARAELAKFDSQQKQCVTDASDMRAEAERWIQYKQELPQRLAAMKASYESLHAFDVDAAVAPAQEGDGGLAGEADGPGESDRAASIDETAGRAGVGLHGAIACDGGVGQRVRRFRLRDVLSKGRCR